MTTAMNMAAAPGRPHALISKRHPDPAPANAFERQPLDRPAVLRVDGLHQQRELLAFASELEAQAEVSVVTLVRGQLDDCWFSVQTSSVGSLMQALGRLDHFETRLRPHPAGVDAVVRYIAPAMVTPEYNGDTRLGLLSQRPRIRLVQPEADVPAAQESATPASARPAEALSAPAMRDAPQELPIQTLTPAPVAQPLAAEAPAPQAAEPSANPWVQAAVWTEAAPAASAGTSYPPLTPGAEPAPVAEPLASVEAPAAYVTTDSPPVPPVAPATTSHVQPLTPIYMSATAPVGPPQAPSEPAAQGKYGGVITSSEPAREAEADRIVVSEDRPGGAAPLREHLTLVAYPFRSFVALNEFQDAVRALRGVTGVKVRRFYRGTLHLGVDYEDVIPFTQRLREVNESFEWSLVSESSQEIEIQLAESAEAVGAPGRGMAG